MEVEGQQVEIPTSDFKKQSLNTTFKKLRCPLIIC